MYKVNLKDGTTVTVETKEEARAIALQQANAAPRQFEGIQKWSYDLGHGKCMIK